MQDEDLSKYLLRIGDTCLILGHRMSELMGHAPVLEEDLSIANIALEQVDQARAWLTLAGELTEPQHSEDELAYHRDQHEFLNLTLAEQPNGHFGDTVVRQLLLSAWQREWYRCAAKGTHAKISELANKFLPQTEFHWRWARDWLVRLGDGTLSHHRTQTAVDSLWRYSGELFTSDNLDGVAVSANIVGGLDDLPAKLGSALSAALTEASLLQPTTAPIRWHGKRGEHGEALGILLADMQSLARAHPDAQW